MTPKNYKYTFETKTTTKQLVGWPRWGAVHIIDLK